MNVLAVAPQPRPWRMVNPKTGWVSTHVYITNADSNGAYWCVTCERWETIDGDPFGVAPAASATMAR